MTDVKQRLIDRDHLTKRSHVTVELDAVLDERDEAIRQLDNANRINQQMADACTKLERENAKLRQRGPAELAGLRDDLSAAIGTITTVVAAQHDLLDGTGSLGRAADIRRRQIARGYTLEHDREHGRWEILQAARALLTVELKYWPWNPDHFMALAKSEDRLLHVVALVCAAQDVIDAEKIPEVSS